MNKIFGVILLNVLISVFIYLSIAIVLIIIDKKSAISDQSNISFDELIYDNSELPVLESYITRDRSELKFRYYTSSTDNVIILIHGSGWHSSYLLPLAKYLSSENIAKVYTPDLRGHGENPHSRGDIKYINQLEDDLADFIIKVKQENPTSKIIVGGHSSGGGLVVRFAGSKYSKVADAYILLSPFLKYNAPTTKQNSGGWAEPHTPRIIGLSMLNNIGITWFNYLKAIDFNMPQNYRDGTETLTYSFRLNTGFAPRNYKKDLSHIQQKTLVLAGASDESFNAEMFSSEISKYTNKADIEIIGNVTHMGVVVGEEVRPILKSWILDL